MADAKSLLHLDLHRVLLISSHNVDASQETRIMCLKALVRFKNNGRSMCLHCSSDEGNTRFQPRGLT